MSVVTGLRPSLEVEHVLRGQGIDDPARASPGVVAVAQEVLGEARALLAPAAMYTILPVCDFHHQTVVLDLGTLLSYEIAGNPLYRRGSIEIEILDGGDEGGETENEILIGTTWRYSGSQAYADAMRVYYLGTNGD